MAKEKSGISQEAFVRELQAANNSITDEVARDIYNVLDAAHTLLAIPVGQRIVVNKSKRNAGL